jgi:cysteine desulfurase
VRIYLDHNATAPLLPAVAAIVSKVMLETIGNASSVHAFGQQARAEVDRARQAVAALVGADASEIVFTSGGTESDNLAIRGAAEALEPSGRKHLITTAIEHEAVLNTFKALEHRGWATTVLPVGTSGVVEPAALSAAFRPDTALVSIMQANNEIGTIQPVAELAAMTRTRGILFHTDAVQSVGKIPVNVRNLGVDMLALSAHKFGGPKGIGALFVRRGVRLLAQQTGGRQERSRRAGTENVPGIAGMGAAAALIAGKITDDASRLAALRDRLETAVLRDVQGTSVNGHRPSRVPNTTNIGFEGIEAESLLIALDLEGIAVSTGSACSSGTLEASHVLRAMGLPGSRARNSLRFSLGPATTTEDIDAVIRVVPSLVARLRTLGRPTPAVR